MKKLLYVQIADIIIGKIINSELKPGDKVQSVREMAMELTVNPKTIQKAFELLDEKNIFITSLGEGRFVTQDTHTLNQIKEDVIENEIKNFLMQMKKYNLSKDKIIQIIKEKDL